MNDKVIQITEDEYRGVFLENKYPHFLKFLELTKGILVLTNDDKFSVLNDFCESNRLCPSRTEYIDNTFKILIQIINWDKITNQVLKNKLEIKIIENFKNLKLGSLKGLRKTMKLPNKKFLDYSKMTPVSLEKNIELFGTDVIRKKRKSIFGLSKFIFKTIINNYKQLLNN